MARSARASSRALRPYHHGNLRRALLDEALATIRREGVERLTLREIGARLGVSRSALYRHFADKRALLAAVGTEGFRTLRQQLVSAWEDGGRDLAAFDAMGIAYIDFARGNPSHYRVMFGGFLEPAGDPELAVEAAGAFQALVDALSALQRDGLVRRGDATIQAARFTWAVVHGVAMLAIDGQLHEPHDVDELIPYALARLRAGIAPEGAGRPSRGAKAGARTSRKPGSPR